MKVFVGLLLRNSWEANQHEELDIKLNQHTEGTHMYINTCKYVDSPLLLFLLIVLYTAAAFIFVSSMACF